MKVRLGISIFIVLHCVRSFNYDDRMATKRKPAKTTAKKTAAKKTPAKKTAAKKTAAKKAVSGGSTLKIKDLVEVAKRVEESKPKAKSPATKKGDFDLLAMLTKWFKKLVNQK
jgi:hypothetical protein